MERHSASRGDGRFLEPESSFGTPIADIVSLETVVNVLIRKGLCTPEELFEEERRKRSYDEQIKDTLLVNTQSGRTRTNHDSRKQGWLKRKMSKRRWSRRLGTLLFGWQWKKVKVNRNASLGTSPTSRDEEEWKS